MLKNCHLLAVVYYASIRGAVKYLLFSWHTFTVDIKRLGFNRILVASVHQASYYCYSAIASKTDFKIHLVSCRSSSAVTEALVQLISEENSVSEVIKIK